MHFNKVEICGVDTAKLPVLNEEQKNELLQRCKKGDRTARQEMINGNLRLVLSVIQKFTNRGENLDDLFQKHPEAAAEAPCAALWRLFRF